MKWHRQYLSFLIVPLGAVLFMAGCANLKQPPPKIDYYTFEYEPAKITAGDLLPVALIVNRFLAAPEYNTDRLVYRDRSFRRETYPNCRWRAYPGDLVSYFLVRDLRQSGLFRAVFPQEGDFAPRYSVEGAVDEFLENDRSQGWEAVLSLTVTLLKEPEPDVSRRILFQRSYSLREPCAQRTPDSLAEAMSKAMAKLSERIILDIYAAAVKAQTSPKGKP